MENEAGARDGGDDGNERPIARGLAQGHGASPWLYFLPQLWNGLEDRLLALVDDDREDAADIVARTFIAGFCWQAAQLGVETAVTRYFRGEDVSARDDRWVWTEGWYAELVELLSEVRLDEDMTMALLLARIRRARQRLHERLGDGNVGNDGNQPPPPPQPPPWPPPPPQPPPTYHPGHRELTRSVPPRHRRNHGPAEYLRQRPLTA